MADMSYQDQLSTLGNMSDQEIASLKSEVLSAFEDADSNDDLVAMSAAADALGQINEVQKSRTGEVTDDAEALGTQPGSDVAGQNSVAPMAASAADEDDTETPGNEEDDEAEEAADEEAGESVNDDADGDTSDATDAPADAGESVTAAGKLPASLKAHEFKKKGAKAPADDAEDAADSSDDEDDEDDESVTASSAQGQENSEEPKVPVDKIDIPQERQPIVASSNPSVILAGADIPGTAAGHEYGSYMEVNEAFVKRLDTVSRVRGMDGDKVIVASVKSDLADDSRRLETGADRENWDKVESVLQGMKRVDRGALVASGGYCAPLETRYDIFGVGVTDRPVRDSLAGFQATRGGIRYVQPPILSSFSGAVGLWTAANDANPTNPTTKPFLTAACQQEVTVTADAITLEIQFGNLMTRAYPELVARNNELGLIYQARFAEQTLLNKISALSTTVSASWLLGTARDFLNSVGRLASAYRTRHRLEADTALRVIAPAWLRDAIREDMTRSEAISLDDANIIWADALINQALASRNVNITWHLDDPAYTAALVTGNIPNFPAVIKYWMFAEGTFLFLDGGTLDLGIVRDSTLVGTNDYRMFVETFEGLAKVGIESIEAFVTTSITGAHAGTITPTANQ